MDNEFNGRSITLSLQLGYGIGHVLNDVCASLWFTYFLVFFHLVLEFSSTQSGNLMLIGQIVDALATPFVGYHSDHTDNFISARYGKRKLWHLFGTVCVLSSFPFIFMTCVGCSLSHKWAQMYYYASFILIFQIGWAAVQISHLSLIPELTEDSHVRTHLTAIRFGFTVFSNLFVYIITWIILHITGECDKEQVGPADAWKFRHIVYIVLGVGTITSVLFHACVSERRGHRDQQPLIDYNDNNRVHFSIFRKLLLYQVAGVYMSTRIVVNISQVFIPLYLHKTLGLAARALAVIPLSMYLGSMLAATTQRFAPRSFTHKLNYLIGSVCSLIGFIWIYLGTDYNYKVYYIYVVGVLIGFGGSQMLVTGLALTADLVGDRTEASAFVYGLMSFTDKLSCGVVIALIQMYADDASMNYYRSIISWVCGGACLMGLICTLILPKSTSNVQVTYDNPTINAIEEETQSPPDLL
ncbi:major facilitator superfamily domain-containing protein 12-like [Battus philenor]|uniref:major facilitator superfamily domain-containing protein 12-like n=1 Tax=Battus philenor TaxID=42288 RepID=UPI0035CF5853